MLYNSSYKYRFMHLAWVMQTPTIISYGIDFKKGVEIGEHQIGFLCSLLQF